MLARFQSGKVYCVVNYQPKLDSPIICETDLTYEQAANRVLTIRRNKLRDCFVVELTSVARARLLPYDGKCDDYPLMEYLKT